MIWGYLYFRKPHMITIWLYMYISKIIIFHLNGNFHYKPSIWWYPPFIPHLWNPRYSHIEKSSSLSHYYYISLCISKIIIYMVLYYISILIQNPSFSKVNQGLGLMSLFGDWFRITSHQIFVRDEMSQSETLGHIETNPCRMEVPQKNHDFFQVGFWISGFSFCFFWTGFFFGGVIPQQSRRKTGPPKSWCSVAGANHDFPNGKWLEKYTRNKRGIHTVLGNFLDCFMGSKSTKRKMHTYIFRFFNKTYCITLLLHISRFDIVLSTLGFFGGVIHL